ncbi:MAG: hypothetical protein KGL11_10065 [Alphaproteobacteria bacterium]|nr:hypothetical protein [Alphaproteobacteria bacterium]
MLVARHPTRRAAPRRFWDWGPWGVKLRRSSKLNADDAAAVAMLSGGHGKRRHEHRLRMHDKQRALAALARHLGLNMERDRRRTYNLRPDAKPAVDSATPARTGREAREILVSRLTAEDEELKLAREIEAAWREVVGGDAAAKR